MPTPSKKPPFFFMFVSNRTNPKVARLTDAEYRAWIYALGSARMMQPAGQWPSRDYLDVELGPYAVHVDALIGADLIRLDDESDVLMSANWDTNQAGLSDPTGAVRQQRWRDKRKAERNALRNTDKNRLDETRYESMRVDKTRRDETRNDENAMFERSQSTEGIAPSGAPPSAPSSQSSFEYPRRVPAAPPAEDEDLPF
jgi:hypothetical protein